VSVKVQVKLWPVDVLAAGWPNGGIWALIAEPARGQGGQRIGQEKTAHRKEHPCGPSGQRGSRRDEINPEGPSKRRSVVDGV
jgi:hypothetical protein